MNKSCRAGAMLAAVMSIGASGAHAGTVYNGKAVQFQYYAYGSPYDGPGSPSTFTAPDHVQFSTYFTVAVSGHQIIYTYLADTNWTRSIVSLHANRLHVRNGAVIYSVGGESKIRNVVLDPASVLTGSTFSASNITFDARAVAVNWSNISFKAGDTVILDVSRTRPTSSSPPTSRIAPAARSRGTPVPPPTARSTPPRM